MAQTENIVELFLLRKGANVYINLQSNKGNSLPNKIWIERKTNAPLATYRTIATLNLEQKQLLKEKGDIVLTDNYPAPRSLNAAYRIVYTTKDTSISQPSVFLMKAKDNEAVTFGNHEQKDEEMFVLNKGILAPSYDGFGLIFDVERIDRKIWIKIQGREQKIQGIWTIERKSSKPLAAYRAMKTLSAKEVNLIYEKKDQTFEDKYPEPMKLNTFYRLVVTEKDGNRIEFPGVFLLGTAAQ